MVLYSLPISPGEILKAKAFVALVFALAATVGTLVIFSLIGGVGLTTTAETLVIAVAIAVEEVFLGLAFGSRFPDFQERPRPRFMDPIWLLVMTIVGFVVALVTAVPVILAEASATVPGVPSPFYLFPAGLIFAAIVTLFAYRASRASVVKLMSEYRI
jgi:hypothetical protein